MCIRDRLERDANHLIEKVGKELRKMMPWLQEKGKELK
jgi:ketol-acid reductoisomerase